MSGVTSLPPEGLASAEDRNLTTQQSTERRLAALETQRAADLR